MYRKTRKHSNGARYLGQWNIVDGSKQGEGLQVSADGSMYQGMWLDSMHHGRGRLIKSNGTMYEGGWKKGK